MWQSAAYWDLSEALSADLSFEELLLVPGTLDELKFGSMGNRLAYDHAGYLGRIGFWDQTNIVLMSEFSTGNWGELIEATIDRYEIDIEIPPVEEGSKFVDLVFELFLSEEEGRADLAMNLTAFLIEHARKTGDFEAVLMLSSRLLPTVRSRHDDDILIVTAQELRSALFWQYLATDNVDKRLLRTSSQLAAAICKCSEREMLRLEAALTQGVRALTG